jgi:hypothetical protein
MYLIGTLIGGADHLLDTTFSYIFIGMGGLQRYVPYNHNPVLAFYGTHSVWTYAIAKHVILESFI